MIHSIPTCSVSSHTSTAIHEVMDGITAVLAYGTAVVVEGEG